MMRQAEDMPVKRYNHTWFRVKIHTTLPNSCPLLNYKSNTEYMLLSKKNKCNDLKELVVKYLKRVGCLGVQILVYTQALVTFTFS